MNKKIILETYKKYGYKMFDCSIEEIRRYNHDECYLFKKQSNPSEKFNYVTFLDVADAVRKINSIFIPEAHGYLPKIKWSLEDSNQLLVKELWFYTAEDQDLYQYAVQRAWALGGHLDIRVEQHYYD
jgi:hypothetical protein